MGPMGRMLSLSMQCGPPTVLESESKIWYLHNIQFDDRCTLLSIRFGAFRSSVVDWLCK